MTTAIYMLAAEPDKYVPALRAEVLEHCIDGKIDKQILGKLVKLDSFLRETGRMEPLGHCKWRASIPVVSTETVSLIISMLPAVFGTRSVRKDFTFSDGIVIPAGNVITFPTMRLHKEASNLSNPDVFDGFRYSRMNEEHSGRTSHVQMVDTDLNYVVFGHGKHAWYDIPSL